MATIPTSPPQSPLPGGMPPPEIRTDGMTRPGEKNDRTAIPMRDDASLLPIEDDEMPA